MAVHRATATTPGSLAQLLDRHQAVLASVIATLLLFALHQTYNFVGKHYDAGQYWSLATPDMLASFRSFRGYVFPALLMPLRFASSLASDPLLAYRIGMALIYGVLLTTVLPAAFQKAFGGKVTLVRRLVPVVLLALLFPGLLLYTLSDLPAVLLAFSALLCALHGVDANASRRQFILMPFVAGALMAAAYNTRTIYVFSGVPLGLMALLALRSRHARVPMPRWLGLAAFAVGLLVVSLPQLAINMRTHGVRSPAVQSLVNHKSLFASQMVWGMTLQRYETTLDAGAPAPQVYYFDPAGARLFDEAVGGGDLFTLSYYARTVAQHPLEFLALYMRHLVNGLDVRDGLVYTHKPSPRRNRTALFNFLVLALAVLVCFSARGRPPGPTQGAGHQPVPSSWFLSLVVLVLPVAAILPGAVETRFFLPVHLLAYCAIAMHFDAARLRQVLNRHPLAICLALAGAAGLFFAISLDTMAHIQYTWPDLYRKGPGG